jgi:tetratricopeptide (TPR) repeat protein
MSGSQKGSQVQLPLANKWADQQRQPGFRMEKLNALTFAKSRRPLCELTGRVATVQLVTPFLTLYYSTREAAEVSWEGIMHKLCPLLGPLRSAPLSTGSKEERERRQKTIDISMRALIDLTQIEATKYLNERQYELALPGALQALQFAKKVNGEDHIDVVKPFLILAEINLGTFGLTQAENYLSRANYSVLKNPSASNALRSKLHRNFGKLYALKGSYSDALRHMAKDIYYLSLDLGPENVQTAVGYFNMGNVFIAQSQLEKGLAFYDKVVDIWYKYLADIRSEVAEKKVLETANTTEALGILRSILETKQRSLGADHIASGEAMYTIALLKLFTLGKDDALADIQMALEIYTKALGIDHPSTKDVANVLASVTDDEN